MTLIVSEVSKYGIAMAADSAITEEYPPDWSMSSGKSAPPIVRIGAQKIIPIKVIKSAIAVWGFGAIGTESYHGAQIPIDQFLLDFVTSVKPRESLEDVGNRLVDLVNQRIDVGNVRGGFHIAGYTKEKGKRFPALYHMHTGHKPDGPHGPLKLYKDYPFGAGRSVEKWLNELNSTTFWLRNGAFQTYAIFSEYLEDLMSRLKKETEFICPDISRFNTPLEARGRYLKLQIQTLCEFYRLSNHLETIAMPVSWITINSKSIEHFEPIVI